MEIVQWLLSRATPSVASRLTGYRATSLIDWAEGRMLPGARTINKIQSVYRQLSYTELITSGFSPSRAMQYAQESPWDITSRIERYDTYINVISQSRGIDPDIVRNSLAKSDKPIDDIERSAVRVYQEREEII